MRVIENITIIVFGILSLFFPQAIVVPVVLLWGRNMENRWNENGGN